MNMLDAIAIRAIRKSLGMTQTQFAVALGKSYHAVASWENGQRHPTWNTMARINELAKSNGTLAPITTNGNGKGHKKRAS